MLGRRRIFMLTGLVLCTTGILGDGEKAITLLQHVTENNKRDESSGFWCDNMLVLDLSNKFEIKNNDVYQHGRVSCFFVFCSL
mmetsp:Transcript_1352/g.2038  ORF Transcript_1352/g.2038 Transcript_1352/m.2038 type:complete len:83 (+) Transcript_1352:1759-2007(+)